VTPRTTVLWDYGSCADGQAPRESERTRLEEGFGVHDLREIADTRCRRRGTLYPKAQGIVQASWPFNRKDFDVYGERGLAIATGGNGLRVALPKEPEHAVTPDQRPPDERDPISHLVAVVRGTRKPKCAVVAREQPDRDRDSRGGPR
jgi:hypothetical protein